jgi:hypothetical protein
VDHEINEPLRHSLDELHNAIRDAATKTCQHIDAFGERLKPGRFLRYLEARAAEIGDRGEGAGGDSALGPIRRSVVYAVPRVKPDETAR